MKDTSNITSPPKPAARGFAGLLVLFLSLFFAFHCDNKILVNITPASGTTYKVGGIVLGLAAGDTVVLQNNGGDNLSITQAAGTSPVSFTFAAPVANYASYTVTVFTQPTAKNCDSISGGFGSVQDSDVINIIVTCVSGPFSVDGNITGLPTGYFVTLKFTYTNPPPAVLTSVTGTYWGVTGSPVAYTSGAILVPNATYTATVFAKSPGLTCGAIANGTGTITNTNVSTSLACRANCGNLAIDPGETCDDGNNISGDSCSATCQSEGLYANPTSFDTVTLEGWTATGLWHISALRKSTGLYSMHYADVATNTFSTGSVNSGALTSPLTPVLTALAQVSFDYFKFGECAQGALCSFDKLTVEISTDGGATWAVVENLPEEHTALIPHITPLGAYAGLAANIRFVFNSVDAVSNAFEGAYVDNITISP